MTAAVQIEEFAGLAAEWNRLLGESGKPMPFVSPLWTKRWWHVFGGERRQLLATVRDDGRLLGIAPLMLDGDTLSFIGSVDLADYLDFIVAPDDEAVFFAIIADYIDSLSWAAIDLHSVPQDSPLARWLLPLWQQRGYSIAVQVEDVCPQIELPATWDEYLASLSKKDRHELRRKLRRLEMAEGVRFYAVDEPSRNGVVDDFLALHRLSSEDKRDFMTPARSRFFVSVARALADAGNLKLFFLEVGGQRAAAAFVFDYGDSYLLYNSGYDPAHRWLAVGLLLKALTIKDAIERGYRRYDFLRGSERYKYDLGGKDTAIYHYRVERA